MKLQTRLTRIALLSACTVVLVVGALSAIYQARSTQPLPLAAFAPSGALLSIESPDFTSLLNAWSNSAEQKRWLASADYADFSRSRLFDRLGKAQDEFATTAGLPPDTRFLHQIAGSESLLAWYDIGNLEFLYITRLPAGKAASNPLLQLRSKFEERSSGGTTFYVRTQADPARTVAFAIQGDYLLLATREDLIANALQLMQHPADRTLRNDAWYSETLSASDTKATPKPDLRMALNLSAIVRSPYFRSYWLPQNITEMKQYTAARSDLYRVGSELREERILIASHPEANHTGTDLSPVLAYVPVDVGVYRAQAQPSTAEILTQFDDKLLIHAASVNQDSHTAPIADLSTPSTGDTSELDSRIDTPLAIAPSETITHKPLHDLITAASPSAMLTFATGTQPNAPTRDALLLPLHSAIVLASDTGWNPEAIKTALEAALLPKLSVTGSALTWTQQQTGATPSYQLSGPQNLVFAIQNNTLILCSDETTLQQLLEAASTSTHTPHVAAIFAGFSHTAESAPYLHLVKTLDHSSAKTEPAEDAQPFFSGNIAGLSETFRDLDTETFTEFAAPDHTVHQTVIYQWKH